MRIITLTVNPAVDKSTAIERLIPEQKLRCESPRFDAGGGGINVSKAIQKLGGKSLALFTAGGLTGQLLEELVRKEGIDYQPVSTKADTRENFTVTETATNAQFRFGMPGAALTEAEVTQILDAVAHSKSDYLVASGSLPPGVSADFYEKVAAISKKMGAKLILDTSGEALKAACDEGVYLLKPNVGELAALVGVENLELNEVEEAAQTLIGDGKCEVVVVSLGAKGAMLVTRDAYEYCAAPTVKKRSTVGAGDSMVAGMTWALTEEKSFTDMVRWGVACGSAATMNEGTQLFKVEDAHRLFDWITLHSNKRG